MVGETARGWITCIGIYFVKAFFSGSPVDDEGNAVNPDEFATSNWCIFYPGGGEVGHSKCNFRKWGPDGPEDTVVGLVPPWLAGLVKDKFEKEKEIDSKDVVKENELSVKQEIKKDGDRNVEKRKYDFGVFTFLGKIALFFIKSFVLFISLPIIFLLFCTVAGVVVGTVLMFNGVFFIGAVICLLSVIAFAVGLLNIIYNFIVNHRSNWQKLFIVFIVSIVGA